MNKLWVMIKREYAQVVKKKSFVIGIFLTPLFMVAVMVIPTFLATKTTDYTEKVAIIDLDGQGIGTEFAESLKKYELDNGQLAYEITNIYTLDYQDSTRLTAIKTELDSLILHKHLKYYLILNNNILNNDSCFLVAKSFGFRSRDRLDYNISRVLSKKRLAQSNINLPTDSILQLTHRVTFEHLTMTGKTRDFMTMYLGGIIFMMIIFGTAINFGQILMRSVIEEKNSRIIEVIVSSVSPFQLMAGKIIGLGLASLTQIFIWFAIGAVMYNMRGMFEIPQEISDILFNPTFLFFFIAYLIIGYLLFSTLFALIGSIVNTDKEAQGFIMPITFTMLLPMFMAVHIVQEPDSTLSTVLSLIPFITPTMMVLRLNFAGVETFSLANPVVFQAVIGLAITTVTFLVVVWIVGKIFRVGVLMYGKRPTLPEIIKWIKYK